MTKFLSFLEQDTSEKESSRNTCANSVPNFTFNQAAQAQNQIDLHERRASFSCKFQSLSGNTLSLRSTDGKFSFVEEYKDDESDNRSTQSMQLSTDMENIAVICASDSRPPLAVTLNKFKSLSGKSLSLASLDST